MNSTSNSKRIAVIGGGIAGLAAALKLVQCDPAISLSVLEASDKLGGVLQTVRRDGFLIEQSADNFVTNVPWAMDLCRRIGFDDELISTDDRFRRALVVHRGRLVPVPEGFALMAPARIWPVLTTPLLTWRGKLRLACEYLLPARRNQEDESLESFALRRLGREAYEHIVQPLVGGIYTADPKKLSLAATLPRFLEMERQHGGLIRGAWRSSDASRQASGARYSLFVAPKEGMASLVDALAAQLPAGTIRTNWPVQSVGRPGNGPWHVRGPNGESEPFDAIVLAVPAMRAADVTIETAPQLAHLLRQIPYAGASVVSMGYHRKQIEHPLDGFGFVVPAVENRRILAGSFASVKYPHRAPEDHVLIRVFVGGAMQSELLELSDDELQQLVREELAELIGARGEPTLCHVTRWPGAMPQYHLGHLQLVASIEEQAGQLSRFEIAGNAYHGVGVPQCIHNGEQAAQRLLDAWDSIRP